MLALRRFLGLVLIMPFLSIIPIAPAQAACTDSGSGTIAKFLSVGSCNWTVPAGVTSAQVLIVGGGGAGGSGTYAGGGGAGRVVYFSSLALTPGASMAITVGNGGALNNTAWEADVSRGGSGGDSSFSSYTAVGGGGGAGNTSAARSGTPLFTVDGSYGVQGGSVGGQGQANTATYSSGSPTTAPGTLNSKATLNSVTADNATIFSYGNKSGAMPVSTTVWGGSGGGGAGGVGQDVSACNIGGNGGIGITTAAISTLLASASLGVLSGGSRYIAGGGGGGGRTSYKNCGNGSVSTYAIGGTGGGGNGAVWSGSSAPAAYAVNAGSGTDNTGSGGGGSGCISACNTYPQTTGKGGTGFVLISYTVASKIDQAPLTLFSTSGAYGSALTLTTSGGSAGASSYALTGSGATASGCSISGATLTVSSYGTCKVTASRAGDDNYNIVYAAETIVTFAKADTLTITANSPSAISYGGSTPTNGYSTSGLAGSDAISSVTYTYTNQVGTASYNSATAPTNAGSYSITPSAVTFSTGASANYTSITYAAGTFTINKATPTISLSYGAFTVGQAATITAAVSVAGSVNFMNSSISLASCSAKESSGSLTLISTCSYTPITAGSLIFTAIFTPTESTNYNSRTSSTYSAVAYALVKTLVLAPPTPSPAPVRLVLIGQSPLVQVASVPAPTITGFKSTGVGTPSITTAARNALITITGTNLTGATLVKVNGVIATITAITATSVTVRIPTTSLSGKISVSTPGGTATSANSLVITAS
ncbi:MAG: hypothetical protein F2936_05160 [Actinobacteria bacterium]|nr:hypothetical protein [Actinomycetota bacterium]MTB00790.1 hypothetical protein [Actinomycetota bacterium]